MSGFEVRTTYGAKGKGLFATKHFNEGDIILEESPLISCQFTWNETYKYLACDYCMRPLETAQQNVRRLSANPALELPYPECCVTKVDNIVSCESCGTPYCCQQCKEYALNLYHRVICHDKNDKSHPLEQLLEAWKQIHYPPEATSIMLTVRILALIIQSPNPPTTVAQLKQFYHRTISEDTQLVHKLLGKEFAVQLETLRTMTAAALTSEHVQEFLTPEGFCTLMALIGTNAQGIGSSPLAQWVHNVSDLPLNEFQKAKLDNVIDFLYDQVEAEAGSFLNSEGSGLYQLQSACNHSCLPNAQPAFPHGNHTLQLKALKTISPGDEVYISYLDECALERSRHSRQKMLAANYLFTCNCEKCLSQSDDPNATSPDEMSDDCEDEEGMDDMSD